MMDSSIIWDEHESASILHFLQIEIAHKVLMDLLCQYSCKCNGNCISHHFVPIGNVFIMESKTVRECLDSGALTYRQSPIEMLLSRLEYAVISR
jgi:hypothetical protein